MAQTVKSLPAMQETQVRSLGQEDALEREMATHSVILAWKKIITNAEHLFLWLLAIGMSSLENCLLRSSSHFLIGLFDLILSCVSCLYISKKSFIKFNTHL